MNEGRTHFPWATTPSTRRRAPAQAQARPDRVALWAFFLALFAIAVAAGTANAAGGGVSAGGGSPSAGGGGGSASASNAAFGTRPLRKGDRGDDVKTLNWILSALPFAGGISPGAKFNGATDQTVRAFQQNVSMGTSGVVDKQTRKALLGRMNSGFTTYYNPTGNRTSCGKPMTSKTIGFAVNTGQASAFPCGTKVVFRYKNRIVRATRTDVGPGVNCFDLSVGLYRALGRPAGTINYAAAGARTC